MKKNLFTFHLNNSSSMSGSYDQETCEPCSLECKKMKSKINNRKLSEIKKDDIDQVINVFSLKD